LRIFIIAGEASGDFHAANLVRSIHAIDSNAQFLGIGGPKMAAAGVDVKQNIVERLAIIGLVGIVRHLPELKALFAFVYEQLDASKPDLLLLVDYPGFNLRVAKQAKKKRLRVVYYICPQTWAWHASRAKKFPHILDKMLTIFPFEEPLFRSYGADATFVGHPLLDQLKVTMSREEVCARLGLDAQKPLFCLLPGSRKSEIEPLLPVMLGAAAELRKTMPEAQFILPRAETISREMIEQIAAPFELPLTIVDEERTNVRAACNFAWVASGTATLETALLGVPMIILYKTSWLTAKLAKMLVHLPFIGLANIVAERRIVPELLQDEANAQRLLQETISIWGNPERLQQMKGDLAGVRHKLEFSHANSSAKTAYDRAAEEVIKVLNKT